MSHNNLENNQTPNDWPSSTNRNNQLLNWQSNPNLLYAQDNSCAQSNVVLPHNLIGIQRNLQYSQLRAPVLSNVALSENNNGPHSSLLYSHLTAPAQSNIAPSQNINEPQSNYQNLQLNSSEDSNIVHPTFAELSSDQKFLKMMAEGELKVFERDPASVNGRIVKGPRTVYVRYKGRVPVDEVENEPKKNFQVNENPSQQVAQPSAENVNNLPNNKFDFKSMTHFE